MRAAAFIPTTCAQKCLKPACDGGSEVHAGPFVSSGDLKERSLYLQVESSLHRHIEQDMVRLDACWSEWSLSAFVAEEFSSGVNGCSLDIFIPHPVRPVGQKRDLEKTGGIGEKSYTAVIATSFLFFLPRQCQTRGG